MNAPLKRTIFDIIKNKNLVFKLIIFAKIESSNETIKLFEDTVKEYSDKITGLLLLYSNYILCLIESTEEVVYEFGSNILCNLNFCKCFPIHYSDTGRFFYKWYYREIVSKSKNSASLNIKDIYNNAIINIYKFYWELTITQFIEEKLDVLAREGNDRLPSGEILELLISNPSGYDLKSVIDNYYNNSEPEEDEIWPVQKINYPGVDIRRT
ncbi:GSCOCG00005156001-RA-CDS [Cotesia congregata]|nr:GSCOCG00005156001-RA-CDS [Cotesia congregata]